jgi:hypothetical protein
MMPASMPAEHFTLRSEQDGDVPGGLQIVATTCACALTVEVEPLWQTTCTGTVTSQDRVFWLSGSMMAPR